MAVAIGIKVLFFARLRELAGVENELLQVPADSELSDIYGALLVKHPSLPARGAVRGVINQEFADWSSPVSDGDEVAFIPPVSGGR